MCTGYRKRDLVKSDSEPGSITLAGACLNKKKVLPRLPEIIFVIKGSALVYLPFTDTGHEMTLQNTRISINKQALEFGRKL